MKITPRAYPLVTAAEEAPYRAMVVGAFGFRRKQIQRVIRELWDLGAEDAAAILKRAEIDPAARPEVLAPADLARLLRAK